MRTLAAGPGVLTFRRRARQGSGGSCRRWSCAPLRSGARGPGADTADPFRSDVDDVAGWRVGEGRELHAPAEVGRRQPLEQLGTTALAEPGGAVHDEVVIQAGVATALGLDRQHHPGVACDVVELAPLAEVRAHDLVTLQPDPHGAEL